MENMKYIKGVLRIKNFEPALSVNEAIKLEIFNLEKVGQGHGVQHWQCRSPIANVQIY